jgi:hypothetical protein
MPSIPNKNLVFKISRTEYEKFNPAVHGLFDDYGRSVEQGAQEESEDAEETEGDEPTTQQLAFALEKHLEDFIFENIERIEFPGRKLRYIGLTTVILDANTLQPKAG